MLGSVAHIGITVRNIADSVAFYRDVPGLAVIGDDVIEGDEASAVTRVPGTELGVVYLKNSADEEHGPRTTGLRNCIGLESTHG